MLREVQQTTPQISLSVQVDTSDTLAEGLTAQRLDFYIGRLHPTLDPACVTLRPIGPEPIALIVRAGHPLLDQDRVTLRDCLDHDWVMQPPGGLQRRTVEHHLLERGLRLPERVLGTSSLLLTLALVCDSDAVAPLSRAVARFHARPGQTGSQIRILDSITGIAVAPYALIRPRERRLSAAAERVLALIERRIAAQATPSLPQPAPLP